MYPKTYHISKLTWIISTFFILLAVFCVFGMVIVTPLVFTFESPYIIVLFCAGFIFLGCFLGYAALIFLDIPSMYLELSDDGIRFVGIGYRIYTPWENIAGLAWTRSSGAFPSFIQLKEHAVVGEISLEEGRLSRRAVVEKRRGWIGNWQLKADAQYTQYIRTPAMLLRRKERDDGSIDQYLQQYLPHLMARDKKFSIKADNGLITIDTDDFTTPEGYSYTSGFNYPTKLLSGVNILSPAVAFGLYQFAYTGAIGGGAFSNLGGPGIYVAIAGVILTEQIMGGLLQRGICRLLGYKVSWRNFILYGLFGGIFAVDIKQFQKRRDALLIAILPSLLFALLLLPFRFVQPGVVSDTLAFVLIVNLICTCPNLYVFCWLLSRPRGTLLYTQTMKTLLVFEPVRDNG